MSIDQSQYGEYKFNTANFAKVSDKLKAHFNSYHTYSYAVAMGIYDVLKSNKVKPDEAESFLFNQGDLSYNRFVRASLNRMGFGNSVFEITPDLTSKCISEIYRSKKNENSIMKPRIAAFPKILVRDKSFSLEFEQEGITISVDEKSKMVSWNVARCNHAVDRVENGFYRKLLFPILRDHQWENGEGGYLTTHEENLDVQGSSIVTESDRLAA